MDSIPVDNILAVVFMGAPFEDITLYLPTPYIVGTPEYWEQVSLENFVSDFYVQKMNGYKPPKKTETITSVYVKNPNRWRYNYKKAIR